MTAAVEAEPRKYPGMATARTVTQPSGGDEAVREHTCPVVVGVDGSESSIVAARWAGAVAETYGVPLRLVHSAVTAGHFISDAAVVAIMAAATADQVASSEKILGAAKTAVQEQFPGLVIATDATSESAAEALLDLSRHAAMVVVGGDDIHPAAALLLGSTALRVASGAACPVVAWRGVAQPAAAPVVVGVDDTRAGATALAAAFEYAHRFSTPLKAVHTWLPRLPVGEVYAGYLIDRDALEAEQRDLLTRVVAPWAERYPDVEVEYFVEEAKPGRALLDHSADAQLVVVGNHRSNVVTAIALGSTSLNLLHHSAIPVMVCQREKQSALTMTRDTAQR